MNQRLPILPGRLHPSTFGVCGLNCCVRHGNRWTPAAITTEFVEGVPSQLPRKVSKLPIGFTFSHTSCYRMHTAHAETSFRHKRFARFCASSPTPSKAALCLSQVLGLLVPVRSMRHRTSTPGLSTMSSTWDLTCFRNEKPHL